MPEQIAVFSHPDCLLHDTGDQHPECPDRQSVVESALKGSVLNQWIHWISPDQASLEAIHRIHTPEYRQYVEEACLSGKRFADYGDTVICEDSYRAALLAAGAAIEAVDWVCRNKGNHAFSICRPPGHHARSEQAMGFCLFNNVAVAAAHAQHTYNLEKVCIIDWDVHHGNGTQESFYSSPSVLFCSSHQLPLFPHTGEAYEKGSGDGENLNLNCPLPPGTGFSDLLDCFDHSFGPAIDDFRPDLIMISAGFDAHKDDPLANFNLASNDFYALTEWVKIKAKTFSSGKIVSLLEGGYNLKALAESTLAHVQSLTGFAPPK